MITSDTFIANLKYGHFINLVFLLTIQPAFACSKLRLKH